MAVLRSVTYASLFDYPLTLAQLHAGLVEVRADVHEVAAWWHDSAFLQATVDCRDGLYFPAGRCDLVSTRTRREALSRDLLDRDRRILQLVANTPFVRMVALSGSLAHLNAEGSADLDLFVITAPHRVWSVTVVLLVAARLLGWRQRLCLNYVVSEDALAIEPQDLFSANQIIHLKPVFGDEVFERFVEANGFVRDVYPNFSGRAQLSAFSSQLSVSSWQSSPLGRRVEATIDRTVAPLVERIARGLYGWHLNRRAGTWQSRDQVRLEPECLKLHTTSHRAATLQRFEAAVTEALQVKAARAS
jgi:hypothetical protein